MISTHHSTTMHWFAMVGEDDDTAIDLLDLGRIPRMIFLAVVFFFVPNSYSNQPDHIVVAAQHASETLPIMYC